jgi:AsmA protein
VQRSIWSRRAAFALAASLAAVIGAFALASLLIRADTVRDMVKAEIRAATGIEPILRGDVSVSLFPAGVVTFFDVALADEGAARHALSAERLTAHLNFLSLLVGRIDVSEIVLVRPQIVVNIDADGHSNWSGLAETFSRTMKPARAGEDDGVSFSEIRISGGTVLLQDQSRGRAESLEHVDLSLAWPSISRSVGATGSFHWRGEKLDASVSMNDLSALIAGGRSGIKLRLAGKPLKFAFDGNVSRSPTLKVEGNLSADSTSLRDALRWADQQLPPGGGLGRFALKAHTQIVGETVALTNVNVELDGNAAEGVLTLTRDANPIIQGTLAADALDLTPYVSAIRVLSATERGWNRTPIDLDGLKAFTLDLRLSAGTIMIAGNKIGRTAIAASLRNGRFGVTIGEAQAFGGVLKGTIALADTDPGADFNAQMQFTDVDLDACFNALFGVRRLEGRGNVALTLQGSGVDVLELTRKTSGSATLLASKGAVSGLDVEQLLRRLERRPLSGGGEFRTGRTPFDKLLVNIKIAQGTASIEDVRLEGSAIRLALAGSASLPERDLDLKGVASLLPAAGKDGASAFDLPFVVRGHWEDPVMLPDVQSLIRRSGAAAPLLDAVRDRRGRDAIRSAIDQLTRGSETAKPAEPPPPAAASAAPN